MKQFKNSSDEQLIEYILNDDKDALGELYNRYFKKVYQKCNFIVKDPDEAFDLAQEAIIKAFDSLKGFRGDSSFSTWLYVITHRYCIESFRKADKKLKTKTTYDYSFDSVADTMPSEEDQEKEQDENIMLALINSLPEQEKELLLLKYFKGESIESLQYVLNLSRSAIKMRLKRSRVKLKDLYLNLHSSGAAQVAHAVA